MLFEVVEDSSPEQYVVGKNDHERMVGGMACKPLIRLSTTWRLAPASTNTTRGNPGYQRSQPGLVAVGAGRPAAVRTTTCS